MLNYEKNVYMKKIEYCSECYPKDAAHGQYEIKRKIDYRVETYGNARHAQTHK